MNIVTREAPESMACVEDGEPMPEHISDDPRDQEFARLICSDCPAIEWCRQETELIRPTAGTWAGVTYGEKALRDVRDPCKWCAAQIPADRGRSHYCSVECHRTARNKQQSNFARRHKGGKGRAPINHGTHAGHVAHIKRGERPCEACRQGQAAYNREWRARKKREEMQEAA